MNEPIVSIIATFYNQARYIPRLIKSVLRQSFSGWELICVDDCSIDKTPFVLEKFAKKDNRIKITRNDKNSGASRSRHAGIKIANGEYLAFIDGDDWIDPNYLDVLLTTAKTDNLDIVISNAKRAIPFIGFHKKVVLMTRINEVFERPEIMEEYYLNFFGVHFFMPGYWAKLIRKSVVDNCGFEPIDRYYCEDEQFLMTIWPHLSRLKFLIYCGYNWRWGSGVTSYKSDKKRRHYVLDNFFDYYSFKKNELERHNYEKARKHLLTEFKSVIRDCIDTKYPVDSHKAKEELDYIDSVLNHPEIEDLRQLLQYGDSPLTEAILSKDSARLYSQIRSYTRNHSFIKKTANMIMAIVSHVISKLP